MVRISPARLVALFLCEAVVAALVGMTPRIASTTRAQASSGDAAAVACAPSDGPWIDCWITTPVAIGSSGAVFAELPPQFGTLDICTGAGNLYPAPDHIQTQFCSISGNTAAFSCLSTCRAGSHFIVSVTNASDEDLGTLASAFAVSSSPGTFRPENGT